MSGLCATKMVRRHNETLAKLQPSGKPSANSTAFCFVIGLLLFHCSGAGLLAGILRLCGVFLYSSGEKSGDPPAHGLPIEPNHTQHDCGNCFFLFVCFF